MSMHYDIWRELSEVMTKNEETPKIVELNDYLSEQVDRIQKMTEITDYEFGALLVRDSKRVKLDFLTVGEQLSIELEPKHQLDPDEDVIGTLHVHPITDRPSVHDMASFLKSKWEQVMMLVGSAGTIWLIKKTDETLTFDIDISKWKEMVGDNDYVMDQLAEVYKFEVYRGNSTKLKCEYPKGKGEATVDELLSDLKGKHSGSFDSIKKQKKVK